MTDINDRDDRDVEDTGYRGVGFTVDEEDDDDRDDDDDDDDEDEDEDEEFDLEEFALADEDDN